jgi:predicted DNA-binding transcriptional regulator AlpA
MGNRGTGTHSRSSRARTPHKLRFHVSSRISPMTQSASTGAPVLPADLLTVPQLAKRLRVSTAWVYDKTKKGALHPLPVLRVGHFVRFDWCAVCEWMRKKAA